MLKWKKRSKTGHVAIFAKSNEKRQRPMSNKNIYMGKINGGVAAYSDKRHDELASLLPGIEDETP